MAIVVEVPLKGNIARKFTIPLLGVTYRFTVSWRTMGGVGWVLDIADNLGNNLICGIPLVTGTDLLGQFGYVGIGGSLVVQSDPTAGDTPTLQNLGKQSHLYFITR